MAPLTRQGVGVCQLAIHTALPRQCMAMTGRSREACNHGTTTVAFVSVCHLLFVELEACEGQLVKTTRRFDEHSDNLTARVCLLFGSKSVDVNVPAVRLGESYCEC